MVGKMVNTALQKTLWLSSGEELSKHLPSPRLVMVEMAVVR